MEEGVEEAVEGDGVGDGRGGEGDDGRGDKEGLSHPHKSKGPRNVTVFKFNVQNYYSYTYN